MPESFKKRHIKNIEKKSETNAREIFEKPKDDKEPKGKELTPKERYILYQTSESKVLDFLIKNPDIALAKKKMRGPGSRSIEKLWRAGIIDIEGKIHFENLEKLWDNQSRANKILELLKEKPDLTIRQISETLDVSFNCANDDVYKLKKAGLVDAIEITNRGRLFFLPKDSEKVESPEVSEGLKKGEEEIKGTKETKIREIEKKEEEYLVHFYTAVWNFLDELKKNPNLFQERMAPQQFRMLKILKKRGIIKIEEGRLREINWAKFREIRAYASEGKILELIDKGQKEMTVNEISSELKIPIPAARKGVEILKRHGLIEIKAPEGRTKIIFKKKNIYDKENLFPG